jgi:hypothetical protein
MDPRDLWRGQRVIWRHVPRGGYGFVLRIPATVVKVTQKRVTIKVESETQPKTVSVDPASLSEMSREAKMSEREVFNRGEGENDGQR